MNPASCCNTPPQFVEMTIESSVVDNSASTAILAGGGAGATAIVRISNVTVVNNNIGLGQQAGGQFVSWGNNPVTANAASVPPNVVLARQ